MRPLAGAGRAGLRNDLAAAVAMRAGLLDAEETLPHVNGAGTVAGRADLRAGSRLGAAAAAGLAGVVGRDADLRFLAVGGFLERDLHRVAQVAAAVDLLAVRAAPRAGSADAAEDVAEDVAECFGEAAAEAVGPVAAAHVRVDAGMAVLVVRRPLLRVGQHLVRFLALLELLFGLARRVALVAIRVVLHRMLAISLLDVLVARVLRNAEDFVVVALCHLAIAFSMHRAVANRLDAASRSRYPPSVAQMPTPGRPAGMTRVPIRRPLGKVSPSSLP